MRSLPNIAADRPRRTGLVNLFDAVMDLPLGRDHEVVGDGRSDVNSCVTQAVPAGGLLQLDDGECRSQVVNAFL